MAIEATIMICTAATVSDTRWKIIAAAMAEKAKPTVLERLAATKITTASDTQDGVWCASSARWYRDQPKCQTATPAIVPTSRPSMARPTLRPNGDVTQPAIAFVRDVTEL